MKTLTLICVSVLLAACETVDPIYAPKRNTGPCQVIVRDDRGHEDCLSRAQLRRWACEKLGQCDMGDNE